MWLISRRTREYRRLARETAAGVLAAHGRDAWAAVYGRSRDLAVPRDERRFLLEVRAELERLIGMPPYADTATRWLSDDSMFTESKEDGDL